MEFRVILLFTSCVVAMGSAGLTSTVLGDKANHNGWSEIERGTGIRFEFEINPLQIKTNATAGSGEEMSVQFRTSRGKASGGFKVQFSDPPAYMISYCEWEEWTYFSLPEDNQGIRIWTIAELNNTLSVSCNHVQIVAYNFTQSNNSKCVPYWAKEAKKIKFVSSDTASMVYRAMPADYGNWELEAGVLYDDNSTLPGDAGLVVVGIRNRVTGEEKIGTVCDDGIDHHAADMICQMMGYHFSIEYGNHGDMQYRYMAEEELNNGTEILVDGMNCGTEDLSYRDCQYNYMDHDCTHYEDLVLVCGMDEPTTSPPFPTTTPPTPSPSTTRFCPWTSSGPTTPSPSYEPGSSYPHITSSSFPIITETEPLDDEVAGKMGASGSRMQVNPKNGRAKISDVWRKLFG